MTSMEMKKALRDYRRSNHLCIVCGDRAEEGHTRCTGCLQIEAVRARERYAHMSAEQKRAKQEYRKKWLEKNPDKAKTYKARRHEYNMRYTYGD